MERVTIIGGGSWGSALSKIVADNKHQVVIYDNDIELVREINDKHTSKYLPNGKLPKMVTATSNLKEALRFADIVLTVVPTKVMRSVLEKVGKEIESKKLFVNASKGIEPGTFKRVSEIVYEVIPEKYVEGFVALTGPSHAEEVILQVITAIVAASNNLEDAKRVQRLFTNTSYFRVYSSDDLVGAELGGSLKNIFALAAGVLDGLGKYYGDNTKAAMITRGLLEMNQLAIAYGAKESTLFGLAGVGDLIVTTTSKHSRNWQAGYKIGSGKNLKETLASMTMVVEGARTVKSAYFAAREKNIETPIIDAIYNIIYNNHDPHKEIKKLMSRDMKPEYK